MIEVLNDVNRTFRLFSNKHNNYTFKNSVKYFVLFKRLYKVNNWLKYTNL